MQISGLENSGRRITVGNRLSEIVNLAAFRTSANAGYDGLAAEEYYGLPLTFARASYRQPAIVVQFAGVTEVKVRQSGGGRRTFYNAAQQSAILPEGFEHGGRLHDGAHFAAIYPSPRLLRNVREDFDGRENVELQPQLAASDPHLHALALAFRAELDAGCASGVMFLESLANALAAHLLNRYAVFKVEQREYKGGMSGRKLREVVGYIAENLAANLSLGELAAVGGANQFHFARQFKLMTGETPHRFVMRERVKRAGEMLARTSEPIVQIALANGFPNQSHFTRWFKRLTRQTPAEYRRRN